MEAFWFFARHALGLVLFGAAAYGLGRPLLGRLPTRSRPEAAAFAVALGLGLLGNLFFVAGLFHAFRRGVVLAVLIAAIAIGWHALAALGRNLPSAWLQTHPRGRAMSAAVAAGTLLLAYPALYPPSGADALMYHLPAARAFASSHALPALTNLRYPVFPQWNELLWGSALLVGDDVLAQLVSYLFLLVLLASLVGLAFRLENRVVGAWAAGLWLSSPILFQLGTMAYVETALAAFATLALASMLAWRETHEPRWLVVAGALAGFAAATKYPGLFFVAVLPLVVLVEGARGERLAGVTRFGLGALIAAGPWYARLTVLSGNPVWPFLDRIFGDRFWTPGDLASAVWTLRREGWPGAPLYALPWNLIARQPPGEGRLSPLVFALLPIGVIWVVRRGWGRWLVVLIAAYLSFWAATTEQIRFLSPILPVVCLLGAAGTFALVRRIAPGPLERRARAAGIAGCVLLAAPQLAHTGRRVLATGPLPVTAVSREEYLARREPTYPIYRRWNEEHGSRYVVYAFHDEDMKYYCRGVHLGDWFGRGRYADVDLGSGAALYRSLRGLGADFLLVDAARRPTTLPKDSFFRAHFVPVVERPGLEAYALTARTSSARAGPDAGRPSPAAAGTASRRVPSTAPPETRKTRSATSSRSVIALKE